MNGENSFELQVSASDSICVVAEDFKQCVVSKFRNDAVGNVCKTDLAVLLLGDRQLAKRKGNNKKSVMTDMRLLGNLIYKMQKRIGLAFKGEDLLKRKHFNDLIQTIVEMTSDETSDETKAGLRLALGYVFKRLITILVGFYIQHDRMDESNEVDLFRKVFEMNWAYTFQSAQVTTELHHNTLRKPTDLPLGSDVKKQREFMINEMNGFLEPYKVLDGHDFVKLRNIIVAKLTLFNA